jgi:hypothetical protein
VRGKRDSAPRTPSRGASKRASCLDGLRPFPWDCFNKGVFAALVFAVLFSFGGSGPFFPRERSRRQGGGIQPYDVQFPSLDVARRSMAGTEVAPGPLPVPRSFRSTINKCLTMQYPRFRGKFHYSGCGPWG